MRQRIKRSQPEIVKNSSASGRDLAYSKIYIAGRHFAVEQTSNDLARLAASHYTSTHSPPARVPEHMIELLQFVNYLLNLYIYILLASVIFSWLVAFNVINPHNQFVRSLGQALDAVTEPFLRPIRRMMPDLGGLDISPMILILIIFFVQSVVLPNIAKAVV